MAEGRTLLSPSSGVEDAVQQQPFAGKRFGIGSALIGYARQRLSQYSGLAASVALMIYLFTIVDVATVRNAAHAFSSLDIAAAFASIAISTALACVRYSQMLSLLGLTVPWRLAIRANVLGIIGGLMFFQIVGQTLARTAVLAREGIEGPVVVVANIMERLTVMLWLALLASASFVYLFGGSTLATLGGNQGLIKFAGTLALSVAAAAYASRRLLKPMITGFGGRFFTRSSLSISFVTLLTHQATLAAYVVLASALAPEAKLLDIAAASAVVMFAASMPISFAGWGVRELSAVYAYQAIGIPAAEAFTISLALGLLSLAAVIVAGMASQLLGANSASPPRGGNVVNRPAKTVHRITRTASLLLPTIAAVLVFFSARVPIRGGELNFNLADPVAICGGLVFLYRFAQAGWKDGSWQASNLNLWIAFATASISLALVLGFTRFGYTEWAFFSRYIGWFVLLTYAATGALIVGDAGEAGRGLLLKSILSAGLAVCLVDLCAAALQTYGVLSEVFLNNYPSGAAQNVNAYGIQLCVLLAVLLGGAPVAKEISRGREALIVAALSLVLANAYLAHSRTTYVVAIALLLFAYIMGFSRLRTVIFSSLFAAVIVIAVTVPFIGADLDTPSSALKSFRVFHATSDAERLQTIRGGIDLWLSHPFLGAGLGAYAEDMRRETGRLLVIHNTLVWSLAELGLLGAGTLLLMFWSLWSSAWMQSRGPGAQPTARILLLTLVAAALFQLPHDALYQRIFWFVTGVTLFRGPFKAMATSIEGIRGPSPEERC